MFPLKDNIPTDSFPVVTVALILANVLMFFLFQKAGISLTGAKVDDLNTVEYGAIPYELTHWGKHCGIAQVANQVSEVGAAQIVCEGQDGVSGGAPGQPPTALTVLSSMFMHGGLLHIIGNMLFLWIFGNNVEDAMGRVKFLLFYLLGGLAAIAGQTLIEPGAAVPTIGASGAVAGVLGGYILLYPRAKVLTLIFIILFFTVIELPAFLILGFWFVQQIAFGSLELANPAGGGGGVAYFAHIGGFAFGLIFIRMFATKVKDVATQPKYPVY